MADGGTDRRTLIGMGALIGGAGLAGEAAAQPADGAVWRPAMEAQDAWMDRAGTRHRVVFDTTTIEAATASIYFADTVYTANRSGYGLGPEALGVILVFRHFSTPFGFDDAMWAKYGGTIADKLKMEGEQAIRATRQNPLLSAPAPKGGAGPDPKAPKPDAKAGKPYEPVTLASLAAKGARFAVCGTATEGLAGQLARETGGDAKAIKAELAANLVPGAVLVPAGIVAVNRAQEHGYALVNISA